MSRFDEEPDGDPHGECEAEIKSLKYQLTNYRIAHEQQAATIADLRAQLDASQCRVELLESDMKSGTYETLYAQQAARITRLEAENAAYKAAAPLCEKHRPNGGTRATCLVCVCIKLSTAIDRIDYVCDGLNEMEVSGYTVHCNEDVVVENVKKLKAENAEARELLNHVQATGNGIECFDVGSVNWFDAKAAFLAKQGDTK